MTSQPTSKRPVWFPFAVIGGMVAVLAVAWSLLSTGTPQTEGPRETFILTGRITVPARVTTYVPNGGCIGEAGYSDIQPGTEVTVHGTSGSLLAAGVLTAGRMNSTRCAYGFTIAGVPRGEGEYVVEVSSRGSVSIDEVDATTSGAVLTLG